MRCITGFALSALFLAFFLAPRDAAAAQSVQISESFVNVYEYLDPKSTVLKMAKKGDRFDLIYAGTSWYQVKVGDKTGWVERKSGFIVDEANVLSRIFVIIAGLVVLAGAVGAISLFIKKQKTV